ncbi:hypothetical protein V5799_013460 [Amblyomma americanum]|uniref:Uncharacterized protein n=1 Tax=Amblyomma americanum TaxID=6943 RepID=A0AAQ4E5T9_AMBAM
MVSTEIWLEPFPERAPLEGVRAFAGLFRGVPNEMERLPMMVPSLEDFRTTVVVASVTSSLIEIDDDTSVVETPAFRVISGADAISVKFSPDLERLFLPSSICTETSSDHA